MKKNLFNLRKGRWLLLMLLSLIFGGGNSAWAQVTETFDELSIVDADGNAVAANVVGYGLSNGWKIINANGTAQQQLYTSGDGYQYVLGSSFHNSGTSSLYSTYGTTNTYILIPVKLSGDLKITARKTSSESSSTGILYIYEATENEGVFTVNTRSYLSRSYLTQTFTQYTTSIGDEGKYVAINLVRAAIDDVIYIEYVEPSCKKPTGLTFSNITAESANINWTAGDENQDTWQVVYSTDANFDMDAATPINVNTASYSFTNLEYSTTYYVAVRAYCSAEEQSKWVTTSFKTSKVAVSATGFTDDFESDKGWELINGTVPNKWVRGTGTNSGGNYSLYISNDGVSYPTSSYGGSSLVYATKLFSFEVGDYTISYDWKCYGEGNYDFLRVGLVPASVELTASSSYSSLGYVSTLPTGWTMWLDGGSKLGGSTTWANKSVDITIAEAGNYQVVFAWRNDGSQGNSPAAIDNFKILGSAPVLELGGDVVGTTLTFGSVAETTEKTIRITNSGKVAMENITLTETADEDNVFAYAALPKTTLAANESMDVTVTFSGNTAKDYTGTFSVSADDCNAIDVTVTATYSNSPAQMAVTLDDAAVGESVAFGSVGKQAVKTFTVTNDGDQTLNVTIASNNTADFTVAPAALAVTGHSSETFTVTFVYPTENPVLDSEKTATITVTPSNEGLNTVSFTVTGTRIEQWSEDFSGNALPEGWENENNSYWTFSNGVAVGSYAYNTNYGLITPLLTVEEGAILSFQARATSTYENLVITMSKNGGAWEACKTISYSNLPTTMTTFTIDGLEAGNYKFRFKNGSFELDNFVGFKRNMNDPKLGVYSDVSCTTAVATSVTKDFGIATETQTATYYIKNDGTGTMTLSLGTAPDGITQSLDKTSVTAGDKATLTISMPAANNGGYHGGDVVVTATDLGTFTVATSGVIVEDGKLNLNFATDNIPATWTAGSWSKNANGYVGVGYSNTPQTMLTSNLSAEASEDLVVIARQEYTSSSYSFGVKYKKIDAEEWSDLIPATNIGTSYVTLHGTIGEAGTYQLQFNGQYTQIQRIYGLSEPLEPVMVVYDGENVADDSHNFGNVSDEADAIWTLTVKNEGHATLTGLAASLTGDNAAHYSYEITGTTGENNDEIAVNAQATITVKQLKDNLGSHSATLTISATGLGSKVFTLSGDTYDHTKMFVDFANGVPSAWTTSGSWTTSNGYAQAPYSGNATMTSPALAIAAGENLVVDLSKYYNNNNAKLTFRYTTDGGITWTEQDLSSDLTYNSFTPKTLSLGNTEAVTAIIQFVGTYYARIDNIYGGVVTTAPILALTEGTTVVADGDTKAFGNLTSTDGVATYTLTNSGTANMVSNVYTTGWATAAFSGEGEGVTLEKDNNSETYNKVTLAPSKSATLTLTMPFGTTYGQFDGTMVIETEGWVGDMTVNYTANLIDPTAVNETFATTSKPEGWYNGGWTFNGTNAYNSSQSTEGDLITSLLTVSGEDDILTFDARAYFDGYSESLTVSYSTDRVSWTDKVVLGGDDLTGTDQTFEVKGLSAGNYYLKFTGKYVRLDNIMGWHYATPAPEHDLYIPSVTYPSSEGVITPGTEITVTATVASLRANEEGVYTKLYYRDADHENQLIELATSTTSANISKDGTQTFTMTANVPTTESHYRLSVSAFLSDGTELFHTGKSNLYTVAHTRTLEITGFALTSEATVEADANNQFTSTFNVTVQNTGTVALPAGNVSVSITDANGNAYETATWTAANSQTVFCNPGEYMNDGAVLALHSWGNVETWTLFEETNISGFYSAELNGNTNFNIVRLKNSSTEGYNSDNNGLNWDNKYNQSTDMSTSDGNVFTFKGWNDKDGNGNHWFTYGTMAELATGISTTLEFTVTTSAQEGGEFTFNAKENVSETVYATAKTVTVTAHAPRFALYESENAVTAGDEFNYGTVKAPATVAKTFTIKNEGNAPLEITGYAYPMGYTVSPAFPSNGETIAVGESKSYTMTLDPATTNYEGVVNDNFSIEYTVDNTTKTFSVHFSGRAVAEDTWMVDFEDGVIPSNWDNSNNWTVGESDGNNYATLTGWDAKSIVTPRLLAEANEELTFDVISVGNSFTYAYSTDKNTWSDEVTVSTTGEQTFTAPAAGNYYLRFTTRNGRLDNLIGFKLNPVAYEIAASNVPASTTQYADYEATVSVKKNTGDDEQVTANLYVDNTKVATQTQTLSANTTTEFTLAWVPETATTGSVEAYIEVTYGESQTLETEKVNLTVAEAYTLDEAVAYTEVETGVYPALVLKRKLVAGWNTVCLPFELSVAEIHSGAVAYKFDAYNTTTKELTFNKATTLSASIPYVVYVPEAVNDPYVFKNKEISSANNTAFYSNHDPIKFQGSYAPVDFSTISETCYGLTAAGKIAKIKSTAKMNAFRAYFTGIPTEARVNFIDDETTTGIRTIEIDTTAPEGTFNLNGQKVDQLNRSGLYIINGKKVVVK